MFDLYDKSMEQIAYDRPREKLRKSGAGFLTMTELLQIIIGSGTSRASGARLAKRVEARLRKGTLTLEALMAIEGIGSAKASQVLAAVELGGRLIGLESAVDVSEENSLHSLRRHVRASRQLVIVVQFSSGSDGILGDRVYQPISGEHPRIAARAVCADALMLGARSVLVCIGSKKAELIPTIEMLSSIDAIRASVTLLQLDIQGIYIANSTDSVKWSG